MASKKLKILFIQPNSGPLLFIGGPLGRMLEIRYDVDTINMGCAHSSLGEQVVQQMIEYISARDRAEYDLVIAPSGTQLIDSIRAQHLGPIAGYAVHRSFDSGQYEHNLFMNQYVQSRGKLYADIEMIVNERA